MSEAKAGQGRCPSLTARLVGEAEAHLSRADKIMARLVAAHGPCRLRVRRDHFPALARSIIGQQLSAKAAECIAGRVREISAGLDPAAVMALTEADLRCAGLSAAKARGLRELAGRVVEGRLDFKALGRRGDEEVVACLTEVPGIGRWTAEMFLIFGLARADVISLGDAALRRAVRRLYGERATLERLSARWRPYRSVAAWHLWRSLDD